MRKLVLLCASLFTIVLSISASPVLAQSVLFVSPVGSDANACSETAPCATFQGAYNKGSVSQINCLGSGFYGPITITGSLTIDCGTGNVGNIVSSSTSAIVINISAPAIIILRHLALNGTNSSGQVYGIQAGSSFFSGTLIVEDSVIQGYSVAGIDFAPGYGRGLLQVSNSQIFASGYGISAGGSNGQTASVTLNHVELVGNTIGLNLVCSPGIAAGTMRKSVVGGGSFGVLAGYSQTNAASQIFFTIEESSIVDNVDVGIGITTSSPGVVINVGASTIGGNGAGVNAGGAGSGSIISFGNNQMSANGSNGIFTSTTPRL